MHVHLPAPVAPASAGAAGRPVATWTLGQLLTAEVIGPREGNYTRLAVDGATLSARSELPLPTGARLSLRVDAVGREVVLRVLGRAPPAPNPAARALARVLPVQADLPDALRLMQTVDGLVRNRPGTAARPTHAQGAALMTRAGAVLERLPRAGEMRDPARLRGALEQAARPLEARLAAAPGSRGGLEGDLRLALQRLAQALETRTPTPRGETPGPSTARPQADSTTAAPRAAAFPQAGTDAAPMRTPGGASEFLDGAARTRAAAAPGGDTARAVSTDLELAPLKSLIEATVARLKSLHLQNASTPGTQPAAVSVELPLLHDNGIDWLRFDFLAEQRTERTDPDREADGSEAPDDEPARATVTVKLVSGDERDVAARVRLRGDSLAIRIGSPDPSLHAVIERRLAVLGTAIERHGYDVSDLRAGAVAVETQPRRGAAPLVDDRI